MKEIVLHILIIALVSFAFDSSAQELSKSELVKNGLDLYEHQDYQGALKLFLKADSLSENPTVVVYYYIGMCYLKSKYDKEKAVKYLEYVFAADKFLIENDSYIGIARQYHLDYQFDKSEYFLNKLIWQMAKDDSLMPLATHLLEINENSVALMQDTLDVEVSPLKGDVNTEQSEYNPLVNRDNNKLYFSYKVNPDIPDDEPLKPAGNIFLSRMNDDGSWGKPAELSFADKNISKSITLTGMSKKSEKLLLNIEGDIYEARMINDTLCGKVQKLNAPVNTDAYEGMAVYSPDDSLLFFVSNRPGGIGGMDIYMSELSKTGDWQQPKNMGKNINTIFDEASPYYSARNKTLYFSSTGHNSLGGYDIFYSEQTFAGWTPAQNLGFPVNTTSDDLYFILSDDGTSAYYNSTQKSHYLTYDIYEVDLKTKPIIDRESVSNNKNEQDIEDVVETEVNAGNTISFENFVKTEEVTEVKKNTEIVLNKVFFEYAKSNLTPESVSELDNVCAFLKENESINIEIGGHTDNQGSFETNRQLSLDRARAVAEYLKGKGIDSGRLRIIGYGETMPIANNKTEEGRNRNRRVSFKIIDY